MDFGQRLRLFGVSRFGTAAGSVKAFAEALGMKPSNLQKYLSGEREPGASVLWRVAELGCNVHWLVSGEGGMRMPETNGAVNGRVSEPASAFNGSAQERVIRIDADLAKLRRRLVKLEGSEREGVLVKLSTLLDEKVGIIEHENLHLKGEIAAFERMLGKDPEVKKPKGTKKG